MPKPSSDEDIDTQTYTDIPSALISTLLPVCALTDATQIFRDAVCGAARAADIAQPTRRILRHGLELLCTQTPRTHPHAQAQLHYTRAHTERQGCREVAGQETTQNKQHNRAIKNSVTPYLPCSAKRETRAHSRVRAHAACAHTTLGGPTPSRPAAPTGPEAPAAPLVPDSP